MAQVIASGCTFADIDAVACMVALYEALHAMGEKDVYISLPDTLSASVTDDFVMIAQSYPHKNIEAHDALILVDVSDHTYLEGTCGYDLAQVSTIFDHHPGSEDFWRNQIGSLARIEHIGAAATLVYEYIHKQGVYTNISRDARIMLAAAIVQNTQNFYVDISSQRDRDAYTQLCRDEKLDHAWQEQYFQQIDQKSFDNPYVALVSDFKPEITIAETSFAIAQLELSDAKGFLKKNSTVIQKLLTSVSVDHAFFMSASATEGKTYFYACEQSIQNLLKDVLDVHFEDDCSVLRGVMLRKEVLKKLQNYFKREISDDQHS